MRRLIQATALLLIVTSANAGKGLARISDPGWEGVTLNDVECWGTEDGYGPFDWRRTTAKNRRLVEKIHFTADIEALRGGNRASLEGDLDYTLMSFPNHHRALWAYSKYWLRRYKEVESSFRDELRKKSTPPPECYFMRGINAVPEDPIVRMVFGIYLHKRDKLDLALEQYQAAEEMNDKHAELAYNMGLLYIELGEFTKANEYAEKATALGYPLRGLQRELRRLEEESQASNE